MAILIVYVSFTYPAPYDIPIRYKNYLLMTESTVSAKQETGNIKIIIRRTLSPWKEKFNGWNNWNCYGVLSLPIPFPFWRHNNKLHYQPIIDFKYKTYMNVIQFSNNEYLKSVKIPFTNSNLQSLKTNRHNNHLEYLLALLEYFMKIMKLY